MIQACDIMNLINADMIKRCLQIIFQGGKGDNGTKDTYCRR